MFYVASKAFWLVASPSNALTLAFLAGGALLFTSWAGAGRALVALAALAYVAIATGLPGVWLLAPLENRFARPAADAPAPFGIIVLGGGMDEAMLATRGALVLGQYGSRMTEGVALALRHPQAVLAFAGGGASLSPSQAGVTEAQAARGFFAAMGLPASRLVLEDRSRNTFENAINLRGVVNPQPGQRWLLVTSGFHMPRAMGVFRQAGFDVVAWPADYLTNGLPSEFWRPKFDGAEGLRLVDLAVREWVGLIAYRLTGKTGALLPAP